MTGADQDVIRVEEEEATEAAVGKEIEGEVDHRDPVTVKGLQFEMINTEEAVKALLVRKYILEELQGMNLMKMSKKNLKDVVVLEIYT